MNKPEAKSSRKTAVRTNVVISLILGLIAGLAIGNTDAAATPSSTVSVALAVGLPIFIIGSFGHYIYVTDEHDRQANLWSMTAGWITIMLILIPWTLLSRVNLAPDVDPLISIGISSAVSVAVWAWLRFR